MDYRAELLETANQKFNVGAMGMNYQSQVAGIQSADIRNETKVLYKCQNEQTQLVRKLLRMAEEMQPKKLYIYIYEWKLNKRKWQIRANGQRLESPRYGRKKCHGQNVMTRT